MKTYKPAQVPDNSAELPGFLRNEHAAIQRAANSAEPYLELQARSAEPEKVRGGMVAWADGSTWNPGFGAGLYVRNSANTAWVPVGDFAPRYFRRFMLMGA